MSRLLKMLEVKRKGAKPLHISILLLPCIQKSSMMKTRIVLFLSFLLVCELGYGQQAGSDLVFEGKNTARQKVRLPVKKLYAMDGSIAVLLRNGTINFWGSNYYSERTEAKRLSGIIDYVKGGGFSLALKSDSIVIQWGGFVPIVPPISAVKAVAAGRDFSLALLANGSVVGWNLAGTRLTNIPNGLNNVRSIAAYDEHVLALRADSTIVAWGSNNWGESTAPVGLGGVIAVAASRYNSMAIKADSTLVVWGDSAYGKNNIPVGLKNVVDVAGGIDFIAALRSDSTVVVWGQTSEMGIDSSNQLSGILAIASDYFILNVLKADGDLDAFTSHNRINAARPLKFTGIVNDFSSGPQSNDVIFLQSNGKVVAWGGITKQDERRLDSLTQIIKVATGGGNFLALKSDSTVVSIGFRYNNQEVPRGLSKVVDISNGNWHSLALTSDGKVVAWGDSVYGILMVPASLDSVVKIKAGIRHSMALRSNGQVVCWGSNEHGQCSPPFDLKDVVDIAIGSEFSVALKSNGKVIVWPADRQSVQPPANLSGVVQIAAGDMAAYALRLDGTVVAWGNPSYGALELAESNVPFKKIAAGWSFAVGLKGQPNDDKLKAITGAIMKGESLACRSDSMFLGLQNHLVRAIPGNYYALSDTNGRFVIPIDSGTYQVSQVLNNDQALLQRQICPPNNAGYTASFAGRVDTVSGLNFANEEIACLRLEVQVSSNRRRRCFKNSTIIKYANSGYAAQADVVAHLKLPRYVVLKSSSVAFTFYAGDSTYSFNLGNLDVGQSGQISITDSVLCTDGICGLQQCTKAWLTPGIQPCQWPAGYDGSNIDVRGKCISNQITFKLKNVGQAMGRPRGYKVYADSLLAYQGTYNLAAGDSTVLSFPGLARTAVLRLEAELDSLSPYGHFATDLASCGPIITSIGNSYTTNSGNPVEATDCQEILDSYDPNDKQVFPKGISAAGNIEPGTWLTYRLRFINKGNDTAYMVRIVDTLSNDLDLGSLQFGASSHHFVPKVSGKGRPVLTLVFDPINLPDSARSGQAAASGVVDFRIRASSTAPLGTQIKNHADILFDFNPGVRTNTVLNTLYRPTLTPGVIDTVIITTTRTPNRTLVPFTIQPNPGNGKLTLTTTQAGQLQIIFADGKSSFVSVAKGSNALDISHLSTGLYLLRLNGAGVRYVRE